jgi:hypothetical protein
MLTDFTMASALQLGSCEKPTACIVSVERNEVAFTGRVGEGKMVMLGF